MACANSVCTLYGSLSDGETSDSSLACKSGYVKEIAQRSVCMATPVISNKEGPDYKCSSPTDTCLYEIPNSNYTFETPCACGLNPTASSFCPNIYTPTYTTLLRQVTEKLAGTCHTVDRLNFYECLT